MSYNLRVTLHAERADILVTFTHIADRSWLLGCMLQWLDARESTACEDDGGPVWRDFYIYDDLDFAKIAELSWREDAARHVHVPRIRRVLRGHGRPRGQP